ncbi:MAG: DUF4362 domain-containing protein [Solibacillus sp.]
MKKTSSLLFLLVFTVLLAACQDENNGTVKGVENVDVVNHHNSIEGLESMIQFYDHVKNATPSNLRIVHYTIEGDPLVTDLRYGDAFLEVKDDTTRDNFANGAITTTICGDLIEEVNPANTTYIAVDCEMPYLMQEILHINYNLDQQDLFEFILHDGGNVEYTIDDLNMDAKQALYKKLVLANYLADKEFTSSCDAQSSMNYELQVYINGGQRDYEWKACDHSADGVQFTELANYIIEQSAKGQPDKQKATVQGYIVEIKDEHMLIAENVTMLDYEWLKEELPHIDFENYSVNFIMLENVETANFKLGDKILATIEGTRTDSKPGRAKVEEVKVINVR